MINDVFFPIIVLMGMIILLLVSIFVLKRFSKYLPCKQQGIEIISQKSLGSKEKLAIIEIERERFLIGITSANINLLHHFGAVSHKKAPEIPPEALKSIRGSMLS
tara:strand:+ start:90 stop:404 length:315 start_codon:yes stop_codon:yes gene_type:complete